jgi:hypothetical protein
MVIAFRETVVADEQKLTVGERLWRPPWRVVVGVWTGVATALLAAFALALPDLAAWLLGAAAGGPVVAWPLPAFRRAPIEVLVDDEGLTIRQAHRSMHIPRSTVRAARVLARAGSRRHIHGWGLTWGHAGRRVWDLPATGAGMVRIERDHRGLDLDVVSRTPESLVAALVESPR